jgi:hypothetical protein
MRKVLAAIITLLLPYGNCYSTTCLALPPLKPVHHLCGFVINQLGEPIGTATVTVVRDGREIASMQTSTDGRFAFKKLKAGSYDIRVQANGFLSAFSSIILVNPAEACKKELGVSLAVGMGCSSISLGNVYHALTGKIACGISFPPWSAPNAEPSTVLDLPAAPTVAWIWCKNFLNRIHACGRQNVNGRQHLPQSNLCTGTVERLFTGGPYTNVKRELGPGLQSPSTSSIGL